MSTTERISDMSPLRGTPSSDDILFEVSYRPNITGAWRTYNFNWATLVNKLNETFVDVEYVFSQDVGVSEDQWREALKNYINIFNSNEEGILYKTADGVELRELANNTEIKALSNVSIEGQRVYLPEQPEGEVIHKTVFALMSNGATLEFNNVLVDFDTETSRWYVELPSLDGEFDDLTFVNASLSYLAKKP
jgi:hypothetical protein